MPTIHCQLDGAWIGRSTGNYPMSVSDLDIWTTAAVVGMPLLASDPFHERPLLEMCWRALMAHTNLQPAPSGSGWKRSAAYDRLDPSEKVSVSYFLGMLHAQLVASGVFGFTHLVHVDRMLEMESKPLKGRRPDFIAVAVSPHGGRAYSATWEAKGRTHGFSPATLTAAKEQARQIPALKSLVPQQTIASQAYFDRDGHWTSTLVDPEWEGEHLDAGVESLLLAYYRPLVDAATESGTARVIDGRLVFTLPGTPLTLGLPLPLVEAVAESRDMPLEQREEAGLVSSAYQAAASNRVGPGRGDLVEARLDEVPAVSLTLE